MDDFYLRDWNLSLPLLFRVWMARFFRVTPANLLIVQINVHWLRFPSPAELDHVYTVLQVFCCNAKVGLFFLLDCDMLTLKLSFGFNIMLMLHTDRLLDWAIVVESSVSSLEFLDPLLLTDLFHLLSRLGYDRLNLLEDAVSDFAKCVVYVGWVLTQVKTVLPLSKLASRYSK
jgi:hypothetical protein